MLGAWPRSRWRAAEVGLQGRVVPVSTQPPEPPGGEHGRSGPDQQEVDGDVHMADIGTQTHRLKSFTTRSGDTAKAVAVGPMWV